MNFYKYKTKKVRTSFEVLTFLFVILKIDGEGEIRTLAPGKPDLQP